MRKAGDDSGMEMIDGYGAGHDDWNNFFRERGSSWRDIDYRFLESVIDMDLFHGNLLDVGCGLGDGLVYLKERCPHVNSFTGTDISEHAIRTNIENPLMSDFRFYQHDIQKPFSAIYDTVICLQTIEHVSDPHIAMKNLVDATRSLLVVSAPFKNRRFDRTHVWSFNAEDFKDITNAICLGQSYTNIYWLVDIERHGYSFKYRGGCETFFDAIRYKLSKISEKIHRMSR